jgi:hypothetical protein
MNTRQLKASRTDLLRRIEDLERRVSQLETPAPAKKAAPKPVEK